MLIESYHPGDDFVCLLLCSIAFNFTLAHSSSLKKELADIEEVVGYVPLYLYRMTGESKARRQLILSFLHDRMRATNSDAREQSRYATWAISRNPPLLTVLFPRIAHFYRVCIIGYKAPGINPRDVDHRFFGVDVSTAVGPTHL